MKKLLLNFIGVVLFATVYHNGYIDFKQIVKKNIAANIETVGNTVECVTDLKFAKKGDIKNASCQNDYTKYYNNKYLTKYINVIENNSSIFNSSTATLKFPSTYKKIVWAALFWQGHINNYSYQYSYTSSKKNGYDKYYINQSKDHKTIYKYIKSNGKYYYHLSNDLPNNNPDSITETNSSKIIIYINKRYYKINANEVDYKSDSRKFKNDKTHKYETKKGVKYSAYAKLPQNIINALNSLASPNSEINVTVGNIATSYGLDERLGDYGAWSLIVIYAQTPNISNFRSNIVYYGFKNIYKGIGNNQVNIPINGLILPKNGTVNSALSVFSAEGEYINSGDKNNPESIRINNEYLEENLAGYNKYNVFDSRLSNDIKRYPELKNNDGIDIDLFDVSSQLTNIRDKEKSLNPTIVDYSLNIKASTYNDGVFLSAIGFSTQLYVPKVCYYNLNLYDENGNLINSNSKIFVGEKIQVKYKIKNDEKETAQNVYITYPFDDNSTKYVSNSTNIKNVLVNKFVHIDDNESKENLSVEVNKSLKIGILGDALKQFKPYYINDKYVAGIEFNLTLEKEGNLSFAFYTDYNYSIGTKNYSYDGILPNCNEFNQTYNVFTPKLGLFNVVHYQPHIMDDSVDVNNSVNDLYTQIVNKTFPVSIVKLKDDNHTVENYTGYIKLDLIKAPKNENECKTLPSVIPSKYIKFSNQSQKNINITVSKAYKDLRFRVRYIEGENSCMNDISSFLSNFNINLVENAFNKCGSCAKVCEQSMSQCSNANNCQNGINTCLNCVFGKEQIKTVCSRDDFAIRPYKFEIMPITSKIKAGDNFNLIIKALDYNNNPVSNYDETIDLNNTLNNASVEIKYNDKNTSKGAITYELIPQNSLIFNNGIANISLKYPDVGDLNITVTEINGSEFAKVDEKDTPQNKRFIKENNITVIFIPYNFNISASYKNFNDSNFTYMSNDLNMSSLLEVNVTAVNKQGNATKNYTANLYSKDINVTVFHNKIDNDLITNKKFNDSNSTQFVLLINKNSFIKGKDKIDLLLNIKRNSSKTIEPITLTINKIKAENSDILNKIDFNKSVLFRYGRIDVKNVAGYGNELNTTYQYEYWAENGWVVNKEHNSSIFGDVNGNNSYHPFITMDINHTIKNGLENVTLSTTHALPYSIKINLAIPSWLWYNPLAENYKAPSSTNLNCLTHPCESVTFNKTSTGWGGIGKNNVKSSETNRTAEINASFKKIKANKAEVKKLNW